MGSLERITTAAVQLTNGSVFTGLFHADALQIAHSIHADKSQFYYGRLFKSATDGYLTSKGRFVDRFEAYQIAVESRQISPESYEDAVKELWGEHVESEHALCSLAFNNNRADKNHADEY